MIDLPVGWYAVKRWVKNAWLDRPKLSIWLAIGIAAVAALVLFAPAMFGTIFYKFATTNLAVVWLYWLAVHIWPHSRPSSYLDNNEDVKPGKEIPYAAALLGQILFVAIVFHGLAQLV